MNSALVILAAGIGSRMSEVTDNTSKCIVDLGNGCTPLSHTIKSFSQSGVKNFIIIVGHYKDKVIESINEMLRVYKMDDVNVEFVLNKHYNYHGCEYSLSCASHLFNKYDRIYISEGDSILDPKYIQEFVNSCENDYDQDNKILIRSYEYINKTRSVVAISKSSNPIVTEFIYDPDHIDVYKQIQQSVMIKGESMQLWAFAGISLRLLTKSLMEYYELVSKSDKPINHSGLYNINKIIPDYPMYTHMVEGKNWLNLNTIEDVEKAKSLEWLNK